MRSEYYDALKQEMEHIFGRPIVSSRDCLNLSDEIYQKTQKSLNANTLPRYFGLVKAKYPPSHSTLTILSQYCGFHSVEEIYKLKPKSNEGDVNGTDRDMIKQARLIHYFVSLFQDITVKDSCDKSFLALVEHTIKFLNGDLALIDKFQSLVAKTKNGQEIYFEQFVNIDQFNSYYTNGLRYYLNEKRTDDAVIFAHSVCIFKYWLNNIDAKVVEHYNKMPPVVSDFSFNGFISSRYYAAVLFQSNVLSLPVEDILVAIYTFYSGLTSGMNNDQLFYFEYVMSEALILTGHFAEAQYFLSQFSNRMRKSEFCRNRLSLQNINLLRAIALYKTNEIDKAVSILNDIRPSEFHFNCKKFASILYIYLSTELKRKSVKYGESFDSLINETGFFRLKKIYNPNIN